MAAHSGPACGMTLIEVMVVILIMAIVAAIVVPVFTSLQDRHHMSICAANLRAIGQALLIYRQDYLAFPPDASEWWDEAGGQRGLGLSQLYYAYWAHATGVVRPDGDDVFAWNSTGASGYDQVDDGVVHDEPGETADFVSAGKAEDGAVATFDMGTIAAGGGASVQRVTQVDVWAYCQAEGAGNAEVDVRLGVWGPQQNLNPGESYGWTRLRWQGGWTPGQLDNLLVRFTARTPQAADVVRVATVYAEVTYSIGSAVVAPGDYVREVSVLHCPRASADSPDVDDWPYLGGYNTYDWNYRRDRSDIWTGQGQRRLDQPFPPDNTVVTWCPVHRQNPPPDEAGLGEIVGGDWDLVLWVDGSVSRVPARYDQYKAEQPQ